MLKKEIASPVFGEKRRPENQGDLIRHGRVLENRWIYKKKGRGRIGEDRLSSKAKDFTKEKRNILR